MTYRQLDLQRLANPDRERSCQPLYVLDVATTLALSALSAERPRGLIC